MDLTGFGVLLIGIAFLLLAIYLARVLNSFVNVLSGVEKTIDHLPNQLDGILNETGNIMHQGNNTLIDVNEKLGTLTPLFHIVGDVGEATRTFSSSVVDVTTVMKKKEAAQGLNAIKENKRIGGLYGTTALGYYLFRKKKVLDSNKNKAPSSNIYQEGELRAKEIDTLKNEAMIEMK